MAFSSMVKEINRNIIMEAISDFAHYTKQDIAKKTRLSFPTVSKLVDELVGQDIISVLSDKRGETGGRRANDFVLNSDCAYSLCMGVDSNFIETIVCQLNGRKLFHERRHTGEISSEVILGIIDEMTGEYTKIRSIAIGIAGYVQDGVIGMADRMEQLQGCDLKKQVEGRFGLPCEVSNNMNILISGKNRTEEITACLHIGRNGPGSSFLVNGRPLVGLGGFQGELGFNKYDEQRTFRDIALDGYRNYNRKDYIEYIGRLCIQIITVMNPNTIYLYPGKPMDTFELKEYCSHYIPKEAMPIFIIEDSYEEDYRCGLISIGIGILYNTI